MVIYIIVILEANSSTISLSRPTIIETYVKDKDGKNKRDASGRLVKKTVKDFTTRQTYKELIKFRDGKEKADEYMEKHKRAKFVGVK